MRDVRAIAARLAGGAALASLAYTAFAILRAGAFTRRAAPAATSVVRASILVPLYGDEPGLEANLRAHLAQPDVLEVLCGARDPDDPALAVARHVAAGDPRLRVIVAGGARLRNPKVTTLVALAAHARGDVLVVADSDVTLPAGALHGILAPFIDPRVGASTCLYRAAPVDAAVARFGAMWIDEQFAPSVFVATALEPLRYCFGATMAVRRTTLDRLGGFTAIGDYLADDFALGRAVTALGERVALASPVVATAVTERRLGDLWRHEVRWARTTLAVRPASYAGLVLTYPVPLALVAFVLARRRAAPFAGVLLALALRRILGARARMALGSDRTPPSLPITVARDLFGCAVWLAAFAGRRVEWRGDAFAIGAAGR